MGRVNDLRVLRRAAWAVVFLLTGLVVTAPPGGATSDPLEPPVPSGADCQWIGEVKWTREIHSRGTLYQTSQDNYDLYEFSSVPSEAGCVSAWRAESEMDATDVDPCMTQSGALSTMTWTWENRAYGNGTGTYSINIGQAGDGTFYPSIFGYSDGPFTGYQSLTYENGCGSGSGTSTDPLVLNYSVNAGWCPTDQPNYSGSAPVAASDAQAMVGQCVYETTSTNADTGYSVTSVDTWTWRVRRADCDSTVDSDGGGVSDCDEYAARTDPADGEDDGRPDRDGDGVPDADDLCPDEPGPSTPPVGCPDVDSDGDGFVDRVDDCISVPGTASANGCPDADGDGVSDLDEDNCLGVPNSGQDDLDGDGAGDACDADADGDAYPDAEEPAAGLDPRDPDTDDDSVVDGDDDCPTSHGDPDNAGCPIFAVLDVTASYAFSGVLGVLNGGLRVEMEGTAIGVIPIEVVCFDFTWEAQASGFSSAQLLWNGVHGTFLDQTTPQNDSSEVSEQDAKGRKWEQDVQMRYCTPPSPSANGLQASYPWNLLVAGPGGRIHKVEIDDVVMTVFGDGGRTLSRLDLDDNKSRGKQLVVSWFEEEDERVDF